MAYCPESMVEWSTRWEEVKKTMVRGLDFTEEIMHRIVYKGLYLKNLFRETIAKRYFQKSINLCLTPH